MVYSRRRRNLLRRRPSNMVMEKVAAKNGRCEESWSGRANSNANNFEGVE